MSSGTSKPKRVTVGNVSLVVKPWTHHSGKEYFRFSWVCPHTGRRMHGTRSTSAKALAAAHKKALELSREGFDPSKLPDGVIRALRRLLEADPALSFADDYLASLARARPSVTLEKALADFLTDKTAIRGPSVRNLKSLAQHLKSLPESFGAERIVATITARELNGWIAGTSLRSARYRLNIRRSVVTFFRWCRKVGHLPDETTAAEKTEMPIVVRGIPETYTVEETETILRAAAPEHVPWLALAAFGGIRADELKPLAGGTKSPLDWRDVDWTAGIITVRPETAKTRHKRVVPINAALRAWLWPHRRESGPVAVTDPRRDRGTGSVPETIRLGLLVGGWKRNALRHSFISYRSAQVGLGKTAMEAGNSESEAKRSYNDAMTEAEAARYFAIVPANP